MIPPEWLIAEREFRAYTATVSFWLAMAVGPMVAAGALALVGAAGAGGAVPIVAVANRTGDAALTRSLDAALVEAADLEGRRLKLAASARPPDTMVLTRAADGALEARFGAGFPLSASGRALVARTVERDEALGRLAKSPLGRPIEPVRELGAQADGPDAGALMRFAMVMALWLTLTGSLGMLLQAVVRERANRALEGLLAAARPWEIVVGKVGGVGAVSTLVLIAWLGSAAALSALDPVGGATLGRVIATLVSPAMLARAVAIYVLAFMFYGLVTVAVGAAAKDSAQAQNLARPMFGVLLAAFFVALAAAASGGGALAWLVYAPPFTPFMLLLEAPGALSPASQAVALSLLLAATALAGRIAVGRLTLSGAPERRRPAAATAG